VQALAEIAVYVERALLHLCNSLNIHLAIFLQLTTTHAYYMR